MKNHHDALGSLTGICPIKINKVTICKLKALTPQRDIGSPGNTELNIVCTCGFFAHHGVGKYLCSCSLSSIISL